MRRVLFCVTLLAAAFACQNYDFHHITPTPVLIVHADASINAAPGTPYIMLVEDLSGSMCEPISADGGLIDGGIGAGDYAADLVNGSKIGLVATNLSKVLQQLSPIGDSGTPFYIGLTTFPGTFDAGLLVPQCSPPGAPTVPIGPATATIPAIDDFYASLLTVQDDALPNVNGGTPTAEGLEKAGTFFPPVTGLTRKYILLLTDGLPNCNLIHPCVVGADQWLTDAGVANGGAHGCMSPNASVIQMSLPAGESPPAGCSCSYGDCPDPSGPTANSQCCLADPYISAPGQEEFAVASAQCLDDTHTIAVAANLFNDAGIQTFVIGMGTDFTNTGLLDQIASAGQGKDAGHIQADDEATLNAAISGILNLFLQTCTYSISENITNPQLLEVVLDQPPALVYGTGFSFQAGADGGSPSITLLGAACATAEDGQTHNLSITAIGGT